MSKKLGLALGAGGARGIAHIGFLQALEEAGIRPSFVAGCSMGAIVGACYCAGVSVEKMKETALSLRLSRIASLNLSPIRNNGLFRLNRARALMEGLIGEKTFEELEIPFACVATDLTEGKLVTLDKGSVTDAALASGSMSGAFPPARFGEYRMLVDGGILERVPVREVKRMGAEAIVAVDVLGDLTLKKPTGNLVDTLLRCIDIRDTRLTQQKRRARRGDVGLWPEPALGDMDQYRLKNLPFAYEKGYETGVSRIGAIRALIEE